MALADIYETRWGWEFLGMEGLTVFHLLRAGGGFTAADVQTALIDSIKTAWKNAVSTGVNFNVITTHSVGNPIDFVESDFGNELGTRAGEPMPPHDVATIRFPRLRTDMHHGYKRFSGLVEGDNESGSLSAGATTLFNTLGTEIISNLEKNANPGVTVANYVVVKRILDAGVYRLPENDGELVYYIPTSRQVLTHVKTQNSRKLG